MQSVSPTGTDGSRRPTASFPEVGKTFLVGTRFTANWRAASPIPDALLAYRRRRIHGSAGEDRR